MDIITPESLFGYETDSTPFLPGESEHVTERVVIPDTSQFLQNSAQSQGPTVSFPKYNNYIQDNSKFDIHSKIFVPLKLLGIQPIEMDELTTKHSLSESKAVLSYAQYKQAGLLFPDLYDDSVVRRWGIDIVVGSPLISISVLVPEYVEPVKKHDNPKVIFEDYKPKNDENFKQFKKTLAETDIKIYENEAQYYRLESHRMKRDQSSTKKLLYKSLSGVQLSLPIRLQIWLNSNSTIFNERSNPQCVHWSTARG